MPQHANAAAAFDAGWPDVESTRALELVERVERLRQRSQHRVHQVQARPRLAQHGGDEDALVDLVALFVLLGKLTLGLHLRRGSGSGRVALGGQVHQVFDTHRAAQPIGQLFVHEIDVTPQEPGAYRRASAVVQRRRRGLLALGAVRARRQSLQQPLPRQQERRERLCIGVQAV